MSISTKPIWRASTSAVVAMTPRAQSPATGRARTSKRGIKRCRARHSRTGVKPTRRHQCNRVKTTAMKIPGTRTNANGIRYCHQLEPPAATMPRIATRVPVSMMKMPRAKRSALRRGGWSNSSPAAARISPRPSLTSQSRPGRRWVADGSPNLLV
jgi:hypothetical protein